MSEVHKAKLPAVVGGVPERRDSPGGVERYNVVHPLTIQVRVPSNTRCHEEVLRPLAEVSDPIRKLRTNPTRTRARACRCREGVRVRSTHGRICVFCEFSALFRIAGLRVGLSTRPYSGSLRRRRTVVEFESRSAVCLFAQVASEPKRRRGGNIVGNIAEKKGRLTPRPPPETQDVIHFPIPTIPTTQVTDRLWT